MNTLVVRLKESLDIENPVFLNEVPVIVPSGNNNKIGIATDGSVGAVRLSVPKTVTITGTGITYISKQYTNEYILGSETTSIIYNVSNTNSAVECMKIVGIEHIRVLGSSGYSSGICYIQDVANIKYTKIITTFGGDNFCNVATIRGQLSDICHNTTLTSVTLGNSRLTGTVESMVEAFWNEGRRSGNCSIFNLSNVGGAVKFHNAAITNNSTWLFKFSASGVTVESPSGTTKGSYNGTTWTYA